MPRSTGSRIAAAVVSLLAVAGCSSCRSSGGDNDNRISLQQLRQTSSGCRLPLAGAVKDAGRTPEPSVSVAPASAASSGTVLEEIGGTSADCSVGSDAGTFTVFLVAATKAHAAGPSLLPLLADRGDIRQSDLDTIARRIPDTESGDLVTLDKGNGHVALGIVTVSGAKSAAFVLYSDDGASDAVRKVAERLAVITPRTLLQRVWVRPA